jgi:DNA repair protein RecO (recombination protein O)
MAPLLTDAIVLHSFDYLETSCIVRLLTREAGVQSVLARGARKSRKRFGTAMDLFAQGAAEIHIRPHRELQTLAAFDITKGRSAIGDDVGRFTSASMISELVLRFPAEEFSSELFDAVERTLDDIVSSPTDGTLDAAIAGAWLIIAQMGFTPTLDSCANCHADIPDDAGAGFSHSAGGALCSRCASLGGSVRTVPPAARDAIRAWADGSRASPLAPLDARAHQRLLREFFQEHLGNDRELRAYRIWEQGSWTAA